MKAMKFDKSLPVRRNLPLHLPTFILSWEASPSESLLPRWSFFGTLPQRADWSWEGSHHSALWKMKLWRRDPCWAHLCLLQIKSGLFGGPIFLLSQYFFAWSSNSCVSLTLRMNLKTFLLRSRPELLFVWVPQYHPASLLRTIAGSPVCFLCGTVSYNILRLFSMPLWEWLKFSPSKDTGVALTRGSPLHRFLYWNVW